MNAVHKYLNNGIYFITALLLATQAMTIAFVKPHTVKADTGITNIGHIGGITSPYIQGPGNVAIDSLGNIYITSNSYIFKYDSSGSFLRKIGTEGSGEGQFNYPNGIAFDSSGNIYVADGGNNRIQKIDSHWNFMAKWGANDGHGKQGTSNGDFYTTFGIITES